MEYACGLAELVLAIANPAYQPSELRYVLEQSGSVALFSVDSYRGNPMPEIGAKTIKSLATIREIVNMEDAGVMHRTGDWPVDLPQVHAGDAAQRGGDERGQTGHVGVGGGEHPQRLRRHAGGCPCFQSEEPQGQGASMIFQRQRSDCSPLPRLAERGVGGEGRNLPHRRNSNLEPRT